MIKTSGTLEQVFEEGEVWATCQREWPLEESPGFVMLVYAMNRVLFGLGLVKWFFALPQGAEK